LIPEGWYEEGHGIVGGSKDWNGVCIPSHGPAKELFLLAQPSAVVDMVFEERLDTFHLIVVLHLIASQWRCLFNKVCDSSFAISAM